MKMPGSKYQHLFKGRARPDWLTDTRIDLIFAFRGLIDSIDSQLKGRLYTFRMSAFQRVAVGTISLASRRSKAISLLIEQGLTQDVTLLVRSLWNNWINVAYIKHSGDPETTAQRFIDYFRVFKKKLQGISEKHNPGGIDPEALIKTDQEFEEVKSQFIKANAVNKPDQDETLPLNWHGKSIKKLARIVDKGGGGTGLLANLAEAEYDMFYTLASAEEHCDIWALHDYLEVYGEDEGLVPVTGARPDDNLEGPILQAAEVLIRIYDIYCQAFRLDHAPEFAAKAESYRLIADKITGKAN